MKIPTGRINIDPSKFAVSLNELQLSVRLSNILKNADYEKLGDLHGLLYEQFLRNKHCGRLSTCELFEIIERVHGREP